MKTRTESDSMGQIEVPKDALWGSNTQRSLQNFKIGTNKMPLELIHSIALVKKAAAYANFKTGVLSQEKKNLIWEICDEIIAGQHDEQFPLVIWQTGSGTQTNMNVNEVVAFRIQQKKFGDLSQKPLFVHPNDDVNKSQSTNDVFPTSMRVAAYKALHTKLLPQIKNLMTEFEQKAKEYGHIVRTGRTHMMDATPISFEQNLLSYYHQLKMGLNSLENSMSFLLELPLGGTASGSGLNAPENYDKIAIEYLKTETGFNFTPIACKSTAMAAHDAFVAVSASLKTLATIIMKIANDLRLLSSGPRCGLAEVRIPENEPGSSIMPGKVNPTQIEAITMVCAQVMGNDAAVTIGGMQGHLELNVFMPMIISNVLNSSNLLADSIQSFIVNCVAGMEPDEENMKNYLEKSLMLATALNPQIGYSNAAKIAQYANKNGITLREAAIANGVSESDFDKWVKPEEMV